jgi:integrase
LDEIKGTWLYNFCLIIRYTFIRPNELFSLTVGNVNLPHSISIPANISKNGKSESVVIPSNLLPVLKSMEIDKHPSGHYLFSKQAHRYEPSKVGAEPVVKRNKAYNLHKRVLERLGIKGKALYSWKHTGVCAAYHATNGDIYAIMRQCRHYSISQTSTYLKSLGLIRNDAMSGEW